jgi:hypothetical protein
LSNTNTFGVMTFPISAINVAAASCIQPLTLKTQQSTFNFVQND